MFSFEQPWALALLPVCWLLLYFGREHQRRGSDSLASWWRDRRARLRFVTLTLLCLALSSPQLNPASSALSTVVAVDVSRSLSPPFIDQTLEELERWQQTVPGQKAFVAFADRAATRSSVDLLRQVPIGANAGASALRRHGTNLESAVDHALAAFAPDAAKRLILVTDGRSTLGSERRALRRLVAAGVELYGLPAPPRLSSTPRLEAIEIRENVHAGAPVAVSLDVFSQSASSALIVLVDASGERLAGAEARLVAGSNRIVLDATFADPGSVAFEVLIQVEGATTPATRYRGLVEVEDRQKVLYIEGRAESRRYLESALEIVGFDVVPGTAPTLPSDAQALATYSAVILSDVPADSITDAQMSALESWVQNLGGGLLFAAGEATFGEDGYAGSIVERILPLEFKVKEEKSDVAMMIVLDKSYSMRGEKIELARTAATAALDVLEDDHQFGLIAFDWNPSLVVPLQKAEERDSIRELISRVEATAQTNFFPALEMAHARLLEVEAKTRHVILLSDGKTYPDAYERLLTQMSADGLTISTVAVGEEADRELLAQIAEWGGGRSYFIADARRVISVLVDEAEKTLQDTVVEKDSRAVVVFDAPALEGLRLDAMPAIRGHINTTARDRAQVWLETPDRQPLLATWQYGVGRTTMYTSDVKNRWGASLIQWSGYGPLFAQILRNLSSQESDTTIDLSVTRRHETALVRVDAIHPDGSFRNGLQPLLTTVNGTVEIPQSAPGHYEIELPVRPSASPLPFQVEIPGDGTLRRWHFFDTWDEASAGSPDLERLARWAGTTGGAVIRSLDDLPPPDAERHRTSHGLWPWLTLLALLCFLFELLSRRLWQQRILGAIS